MKKEQIRVLGYILALALMLTIILAVFSGNAALDETRYVLVGCTDQSLFESCLRNKTKYECEKQYGIWEKQKIYDLKLHELLWKYRREWLLLFLLIAFLLYLPFLTYVFYKKCNNIGWQRISIVAGIFALLYLGFYDLNENKLPEDLMEIILFMLRYEIYCIGSIVLILGGRYIYTWIRAGFEISKTK